MSAAINKRQLNIGNKDVFGERVGLIARVFGCWHKRITRPFTEGKTGYRACVDCGARKPFDLATLETNKNFYYPPVVK